MTDSTLTAPPVSRRANCWEHSVTFPMENNDGLTSTVLLAGAFTAPNI